VTAACPSCGRELPGEFPFCPYCAAPLAGAASPREERKVVTVVFCDLVGSTARAERLDPEDVRALLSRYHGRVRAELERFGGTVEKFIGDAVVALFGAPVAHEDDPERAVRAALAIREWVGDETDLQIRIGVNTGPALVTLGARPELGEGMASGDVVNTAARLQTAAPVDGILVGEQTYRATNRAIEYRAADPVSAKGKSEPVLAWEAVQARSRLGVDVTRTHTAPLVGRGRELELLVDLLERVRVERTPQLVTLVGVPGIGKSRLLAELIGRIDQGGRLVTWRQGRSLPYGEGVSFWALGEIAKAQAGVLESDSTEEAARKLDDAVARSIADETEARWVATHLRPLAGVAADAPASAERRGEAFAAWRRFVEALGEERPLVLVFEDLHWADEGLLDFVDELADRLADVPVLVVGVARPELLARRPAWGGGKANATTISLAPLSDDDTAQLVEGLRERAALAPETQAALLEHAGGNPLYAEEFVRMLADRGTAGPRLPESVHGIIAARLDALPPEDKGLLQDAAVLGKVFWSGAVAHVAERDRHELEESLYGLERRELVRRERRSSVAGELEYAFRHVLVREVAYETVPRAARAERHLRAAQWLESLGRPDDHADQLAHHYLAALELARAAGIDAAVRAGEAAAALARAGDRAYGLNAFETAARFYGEALTLGVAAGERPRLLLRLGSALHFSGDARAIEVLEQAREALISAGDPEAAAEAGAALGSAWWYLGQGVHARETIEHAQRLLSGRGDSPAAAQLLAQAARMAIVESRFGDALRLGTEALRIQQALGIEHAVPDPAGTVATAHALTGDLERGLRELEEVVERAAAVGSPEAVRSCNNLAILLWHAGDLERVESTTREGIRLAERSGHRMHFLDGHLSWLAFQRGQWDDALSRADAFLASSAAGPVRYAEGTAVRVRARVCLARDLPAAEAEARRQLELGRATGDAQSLVPALSTVAYVRSELGQDAEAEIAEMLPILGAGMLTAHVIAWPVLADPALRTEICAALLDAPRTPLVDVARRLADGDVVGAAGLLEAHGDAANAAELRLCAAKQLTADGRGCERDEQLSKALAFFRSVGAARFVRESERLAT
jgi:predicted ATPase/class 3 adenylate cyclase